MKMQHAFYIFIFCTTQIVPEQGNFQNGQPPITITINAQTQSGLVQDNEIEQKAKHTSEPYTNVETTINNDNKQNIQNDQLQPDESCTKYAIKNGFKAECMYLLAAYTPLFPLYALHRFIIYPLYSDTPWVDTASEEKQKALAAQGKKYIPRIIVFPLIHHATKYITGDK